MGLPGTSFRPWSNPVQLSKISKVLDANETPLISLRSVAGCRNNG